MSRPNPGTVESGTESWDADVNDIFGAVFDAPLPLVVSASLSALNTDFPPAQYDACMGVVWDGTPGNQVSVYVSDGSSWNSFSATELKAVRISSHSSLALTQTVDGSYVYSLSGFSGTGYSASKVRSVLLYVQINLLQQCAVSAKMFGEASFTPLCYGLNVTGVENHQVRMMVEVPVENGQTSLELQLSTGVSSDGASFTIYGVRQLV